MGYYGALAPQPAVAKEASRAWWSAGWTYLRAFADPYWLWVPLVVLLAGAYLPQFRALRQAQRWRALLVVGGFAVGAIVDGVYFQTTRLDAPPAPGERTPAVAFYGIGITGYALGTNVYILDLLGLADPFTAHLQLARRGLIAHEKPLPAPWIAARLLAPGA